MSIALSHKAAKLMKLCALEGYKRLHDLLKASASDSLCPAICMTEGCDYTTELERDQKAGYCEAKRALCARARQPQRRYKSLSISECYTGRPYRASVLL